jgi:hypothetical protein
MKTILFCTSIVVSAVAAVITYPPNSQSGRPLVTLSGVLPAQELHMEAGGWESNLGAVLDDPDTYRVKTFQELETYAQQANAMFQHCGESRGYLRTRVKALNEHVTYAREELLELPADSYDQDFTLAHAHFYTTMTGLREAFAQATGELKDCK